jgi:hypothetical protein
MTRSRVGTLISIVRDVADHAGMTREQVVKALF